MEIAARKLVGDHAVVLIILVLGQNWVRGDAER